MSNANKYGFGQRSEAETKKAQAAYSLPRKVDKLYFAKYLPVEGKVEMGDKFIDTGVMSDGSMIGTRRNKKGVYDYQKVKLFLCSRDNPKYKQEILTQGIKEGQEFTEQEKDYLTLL